MTPKHNAHAVRTRGRLPRFTIRTLMVTIAAVSFLIAAFQFAWPRRTIQTSIVSQVISVKVFEPHLDDIAKASKNITKLQVDFRTNMVEVFAQARNIDAAKKEVELLINDPRRYWQFALGIEGP